MRECSIVRKGGGGTKLFAAIGVTYPVGSTLTCTNGTKTLTAKNTSGQWVFAIPEIGIWTVTATDGSDTASEAVQITAEGQSVSVELSYYTNYYKLGDVCSDITGGYIFLRDSNSSSLKITFNADNMQMQGVYNATRHEALATANKVDLTKINTLYLEYTAAVNSSNDSGTANTVITFGVTSTTLEDKKTTMPSSSAAAKVELQKATERTTATLDVSELSGSYHIFVQDRGLTNSTYRIRGK